MGLMDLEKAWDRVNREAIRQALRIYDVTGKRLNGIKSICTNSLICVMVKWSESECFTIESGVRQSCILYPCLLNVYMNPVMKEVKREMGRMGVRFLEEGERIEVTCPLVCR